MDFIQKHKVKIAIGAGISLVVGLVTTYLLKGDDAEETQEKNAPASNKIAESPRDAPLNSTGAKDSQPREDKEKKSGAVQPKGQYDIPQIAVKSAKELASKIDVKFNNETNTLDFKTIVLVVEQSTELVKVEYIKLTYENRKARRSIMNSNPERYEQMIIDFNEEVENLLTKACDDLLVELNLTKDLFEDSMVTLMERGYYQQIFMLQAAIRQKIKENLPVKQDISITKTKEIIKYQVKILETEPDRFRSIIQKLQGNIETIQMIPLVINTILADIIFEKFGLEEEDQMKNMMGPEMMRDPEIHELLKSTEQAMYRLLGGPGGPGMGGMMPGMM